MFGFGKRGPSVDDLVASVRRVSDDCILDFVNNLNGRSASPTLVVLIWGLATKVHENVGMRREIITDQRSHDRYAQAVVKAWVSDTYEVLIEGARNPSALLQASQLFDLGFTEAEQIVDIVGVDGLDSEWFRKWLSKSKFLDTIGLNTDLHAIMEKVLRQTIETSLVAAHNTATGS